MFLVKTAVNPPDTILASKWLESYQNTPPEQSEHSGHHLGWVWEYHCTNHN